MDSALHCLGLRTHLCGLECPPPVSVEHFGVFGHSSLEEASAGMCFLERFAEDAVNGFIA